MKLILKSKGDKMNNDITFCNNPRCNIDNLCRRGNKDNWPVCGWMLSMAAFGPVNGDDVDAPSDCNMFLE